MLLIKERNNLYPTNYVVKITESITEFITITVCLKTGVIIKFFFEDKKGLDKGLNKLTDALLNNKNVIIDQEYLGASKTTCNM